MDVLILGSRGIPARHGGFETFAESLALYLTSQGHRVTVYCQSETVRGRFVDEWNGIRRVHLYGPPGAGGTVRFDLAAVIDSLRRPGVVLTLGYNTAVFSVLYRLAGRPTVMNMDGIEWKREKWSPLERLWLRFNEYAGAKLSNHLIADHPAIGLHLQRHVAAEKISVITYGANELVAAMERPLPGILARLGLVPQEYALVIARPEPENSILEMVEAFSSRPRGMKLVVLGEFCPEQREYHRLVMERAGPEVIFPGAIYDKPSVEALRKHARVYLHGHRVGGTNPSLVEALAAEGAVIAHDNVFTRWVAGPGAAFFRGKEDLMVLLDEILHDDARLTGMRAASHERHLAEFMPGNIHTAYERLLMRFARAESRQRTLAEAAGQHLPQTIQAAATDRHATISN